jgi:hypothetical protein
VVENKIIALLKLDRQLYPYHWGDPGVENIRMYLQELGCGGMDWIGLALDRDRWRAVVNAVMNLRVP